MLGGFMETRKVVDKITERIEMYCKKDIEDISIKEFYEFQDDIRMLQFIQRITGEELAITGVERIKDKIQERIEMYCNKDTEDISIEEFYEFHEDIRMSIKLSEARK